MKQYDIRRIALGGIIAALYVILTFIANLFGLASGPVQIRISEALCILPCFSFCAVPGLFIGCLISNIITGALLPDIIFGSIATFLGALGTYLLRRNRFAAVTPPILFNAIIVPLVLAYAYNIEESYIYLFITVGAGELISVGVLGEILYSYISKREYLKKHFK